MSIVIGSICLYVCAQNISLVDVFISTKISTSVLLVYIWTYCWRLIIYILGPLPLKLMKFCYNQYYFQHEEFCVPKFLFYFIYLYFYCKVIIWWLSGDYLMIISWLSHDYLMIISWLSGDYLMIISWLSHDYLMIISWLSHDYLMIISWLSHDYLMIIWWLSDDYLMII